MILYALSIPFNNDYTYLTEGSGSDIHHRFFDSLEEVKECQSRWKGSKIVVVTFKEYGEIHE